MNEVNTFQVTEMTDVDLRVQKSHVSTKVDFIGFPFMSTVYWMSLIKFGEVLFERKRLVDRFHL